MFQFSFLLFLLFLLSLLFLKFSRERARKKMQEIHEKERRGSRHYTWTALAMTVAMTVVWRRVALAAWLAGAGLGFRPAGTGAARPGRLSRVVLGATELPVQQLARAAAQRGAAPAVAEAACALADQALREREPRATPGFVSALDRAAVEEVLTGLAGLHVASFGGSPGAQRRRLAFLRREEYDTDFDDRLDDTVREVAPCVALRIDGQFLFEQLAEADFVEACAACIPVPDPAQYLGDAVLNGDRGATLVATPEAARLVQRSLQQVAGVSVKVSVGAVEDAFRYTHTHTPGRQAPEADGAGRRGGTARLAHPSSLTSTCVVRFRAPVRRSIQTVEASLRVDAVGSSGLALSRSKFSALVKEGRVLLN